MVPPGRLWGAEGGFPLDLAPRSPPSAHLDGQAPVLGRVSRAPRASGGSDHLAQGLALAGGVVPVGLGQAPEALAQAHDGDRGVGEACGVSGRRAAPHPGPVLVAGEVADVVEAVPDLAVAPVQGGDFGGAGAVGAERGEAADGLGGGFPRSDHRSAADDAERLAASRQGREVVGASVKGRERAGPLLDPPVGLVERARRRRGVEVGVERGQVVEQALAVALDGQDAVGAPVDDQPGGFGAAAQRVQGEDAAGDVDLPDQAPGAEDLPAGAVGGGLSGDHAGAVAAAARNMHALSAPPGRWSGADLPSMARAPSGGWRAAAKSRTARSSASGSMPERMRCMLDREGGVRRPVVGPSPARRDILACFVIASMPTSIRRAPKTIVSRKPAPAKKANELIGRLADLSKASALDEVSLQRIVQEAKALMQSDRAGAHTILGVVAALRDDADETRHHFRTALKMKKSFVALFNYSVSLATLEEHGEALKVIVNALKAYPDDLTLLERGIGAALESANFLTARDLSDRLDALAPDRPNRWSSPVRPLAAAIEAGTFGEQGVREILGILAATQRSENVRTASVSFSLCDHAESFLYQRTVYADPTTAATLNERLADRIADQPDLLADPGLKFVAVFTGVTSVGFNAEQQEDGHGPLQLVFTDVTPVGRNA